MNEISTKNAPTPVGPYVQGLKAGNFIFVSGQLPIDPQTGKVVEGGIKEQSNQVFKNLKAILEAAGTDLSSVVKIGAYLQDLSEFSAFNEVYREYFTKDFPCRTTVGSNLLGVNVEIDAIAYVA